MTAPGTGAAQRAEPCPHCRALSGASPHDELRLSCDVCGGPRVPLLDPRYQRSDRAIPPLHQAQVAVASRAGWRAASVAGGLLLAFNLLLFGFLLVIAGASVGLLLAGLATVVPLSGFLLVALQRARARSREIDPALDAAWLAIATDIASQAEDALTSGALASTLGIEEAQAEELLALLEVNDIVQGTMTDGGDFAYNARRRVAAAEGLAPAASADPGALAAEQEALASEEIVDPSQEERSADVGPPGH